VTDALIAIMEPDGSLSRSDPGQRPLYSITKTYIAACILKTGIDLDRPASDWIGSDWLPDGRQISIRQLLNHTSGLRDYGALSAYQQAVAAGGRSWNDRDFAERTLHPALLGRPGNTFAYSNPGYWVLGRLLETELGKPLAEVIKELVLAPLALEDTTMVTGTFADDLPGYPAEWVWHGLLVGTAADTARFLASDLIGPLADDPVPVPGTHPGWQNPHYGYGLMIEPGERQGHNGGGPGYAASAWRLQDGRTVCALVRGGDDLEAMNAALTAV
jgi:D-alanyl-D-alanine carboxypeptidase